jgi:hypothetical protein
LTFENSKACYITLALSGDNDARGTFNRSAIEQRIAFLKSHLNLFHPKHYLTITRYLQLYNKLVRLSVDRDVSLSLQDLDNFREEHQKVNKILFNFIRFLSSR